MKPRVVFDCMVLLQAAARKAGPAAACWELSKAGLVELCVQPLLIAELRDVMSRPRTQRKFPALTPRAVEAFLQDVETHATSFADVASVFALVRDPKDAPYIDLAVGANARYLVSRDKDLLHLMQDEAFRHRFPELTIIEPVSFLRAIARLTEKKAEQEGEGRAPPEQSG